MNPNLETAISEFIANEFHMSPSSVNPDLNFSVDLGLSPEDMTELFQRMEDALNFILPDEKVPAISTVGDLIEAIESEDI
jgi:acyl carrier protein